jgi:alkyl hydroperoxide reductase subunit AhpC
MTVEIKESYSGEWSIIHTYKDGFVKIMTLDYVEVRELVKKFKKAGF